MEAYDEPTPAGDDQKYDTPAPLPMNKLENFEKKYNKGELILDTDDYILFSGEGKDTKKKSSNKRI